VGGGGLLPFAETDADVGHEGLLHLVAGVGLLLQRDEAPDALPLEVVGEADDGGLGDLGVADEGGLDLHGAEAVAGDVDNVVGVDLRKMTLAAIEAQQRGLDFSFDELVSAELDSELAERLQGR
jgi:hypothetical protein